MFNKKSMVAGFLAVTAMLGFLMIIATLSMQPIPMANKDFFNTSLVGLIGYVSTAFGYYLGSSASSARKNEILSDVLTAPPAAPKEAPPGPEAGFASSGALLLLVALSGLVLLSACATLRQDPPEVLAGKSLLAMKATIITAATAGDQLCKQHVIPQHDCQVLAGYYRKAQPAYDLAADSMRAVLLSREPAAWYRYQADQAGFREIFDDVIVLSGQYGLLGGAK